MQFLGTGASELVPSPYCECDVCKRARASTDPREKRARSAFYVDEQNLIDCGPDTTYALARYGKSLSGLKNMYMTHLHPDHFDMVSWQALVMTVTQVPRFNLFLSTEAYNGLMLLSEKMQDLPIRGMPRLRLRLPESIIPVPMEPYQTITTAEGMEISALRTIHPGYFENEYAINYLFSRGGKNMLYACDTGRYDVDNFHFLRGKTLDVLIIEGSFGKKEVPDDFKHMSCDNLKWMFDRFRENGNLTDTTMVYVTHIGHKGMMTHGEYEAHMHALCGDYVNIAYDGLSIGGF